ncbi:MAG: dTDP-4-dehydrorhamnose 3,5-epimerase family protein [Myxococcales bacterium]
MSFPCRPTPLRGCFELEAVFSSDERGSFTKIHRADWLEEIAGERLVFRETYYSTSNPGTLRGLHLQRPPAHYWKLLHCLDGEIFDVILDLRAGSGTFGKAYTLTLGAEGHRSVLIPPGCAHGFCVPGPRAARVLYEVTATHSPEHDTGVLWSSAPVAWPVTAPVMSARDRALPTLESYGTGIAL